jgi:hypothetical protein
MPRDQRPGPDASSPDDRDARADERHVGIRAELLPEERAVGSEDPHAQAEAILAESAERTENPDPDASSQSRRRTSKESL